VYELVTIDTDLIYARFNYEIYTGVKKAVHEKCLKYRYIFYCRSQNFLLEYKGWTLTTNYITI